MKLVMLGIVGAFAILAQPVLAKPAGNQNAAERTTVSIPFSPPLGREIGYRMTRSQTRDGRPRETAIDLFVKFSRAANGFEMQTRFGPAGVSLGNLTDKLLGQSLTFQLDAEGTITGVTNEDTYWKLINEVIDRGLASDSKKEPETEAIVRKLFAEMRSLPDDHRLALLAKNYQPILEMTGAEMAVGEIVEADDEAQMPFPSLGDVSIKRLIRLSLEEANPQTATFKMVTSNDPKSMQAVIESFMKLASPDKQVPVPPMNIRQEAIYVVSATTGLTESYQETIEMEASGEEGNRVTKMVLLPK